MVGFTQNMLSLGTDMFEGDQILHCWVGTEMPQSSFLSMNGVAEYICPPRKRNMTRSDGRVGNVA
jgi:hypothetical protein